MRVFVTGATGFIGSAIVQELLAQGHQVLGLARSQSSADALAAIRVEAHRGDITDTESLKEAARACDAVIHTAFNHDFSKFQENADNDRCAIEAMGEALAGTRKPLVVTSGIGVLRPGRMIMEEDRPVPGSMPRVASEEGADAAAAKGVRVAVVRLPPSVHGAGDHAFVPAMIGIAREKGKAAYVGEGANLWPAVHRLDAARVFCLLLEAEYEPGARFHAVAEEGIPFRQIEETIGKKLGVPVESISKEEAPAYFTWMAHFAAMDCEASAAHTMLKLSWLPQQPGLLEDIDSEAYFPAGGK